MSYLLKIILFGLVIYYVLRFFSRNIRALFGDAEEKPRTRQSPPRRAEGEVRIEKNRPGEPRISRDEGEYVDFEEVD